MMMVLVLHANYVSFGKPSILDFREHFSMACSRTLIEQICIPAVDIFIFISGWFGMHLSAKGFLNILFQSMFYCLFVVLVSLLLGGGSLDFSTWITQLYFGCPYWFVVAYLGLMIASPVLNGFIENTSKNQVKKVLIAFFAFQSIYGWLFDDFGGFSDGYSIISFAGVYSLARYLKIYEEDVIMTKPASFYLFCFSIIILLSVLIQVLISSMDINYLFVLCLDNFIAYNNPLIILSAVTIALFFSRISIQSSIVNWLASSCFAIYLVHSNPLMLPKYIQFIRMLYSSEFLVIGICRVSFFIFLVAIISILIDKIRLFLWNKIQKISQPSFNDDCSNEEFYKI